MKEHCNTCVLRTEKKLFVHQQLNPRNYVCRTPCPSLIYIINTFATFAGEMSSSLAQWTPHVSTFIVRLWSHPRLVPSMYEGKISVDVPFSFDTTILVYLLMLPAFWRRNKDKDIVTVTRPHWRTHQCRSSASLWFRTCKTARIRAHKTNGWWILDYSFWFLVFHARGQQMLTHVNVVLGVFLFTFTPIVLHQRRWVFWTLGKRTSWNWWYALGSSPVRRWCHHVNRITSSCHRWGRVLHACPTLLADCRLFLNIFFGRQFCAYIPFYIATLLHCQGGERRMHDHGVRNLWWIFEAHRHGVSRHLHLYLVYVLVHIPEPSFTCGRNHSFHAHTHLELVTNTCGVFD